MKTMRDLPPIYHSQTIPQQNGDEKFHGSSTEPRWQAHVSSALKPDKRSQSEPILFPPLTFTNNKTSPHNSPKFPNRKSHRKAVGKSLVSRLGNILAGATKNRSSVYKNGLQTYRSNADARNVNGRALGRLKNQTSDSLEMEDCISDDGEAKEPNNESPFSVRKKIEQFRHWHEEQNAVSSSVIVQEKREHSKREAMEIAAIIEQAKSRSRKNLLKGKKPLKNIQEDQLLITRLVNDDPAELHRTESPPARIELGELERISSATTWRTWRDMNDSYAYTDVHRYIKENKLMPPDKESWIKEWVKDVELSNEGGD